MRITLNKVLVGLFITFLTACQNDAGLTKVNNNTPQKQTSIKQAKIMQASIKQIEQWQEVTVKYYDLEGGFYGLVSIKGKKLLPMNLPQEYRLDGTKLKVKGHIVKGRITIQQWGTSFNITESELIKLGTDHRKKNSF